MASQFPSPSTIFIGAGTDYAAAQIIVENMYCYIVKSLGCCTKSVDGLYIQVEPILTTMAYNLKNGNTTALQADVEASYKLIYPYT